MTYHLSRTTNWKAIVYIIDNGTESSGRDLIALDGFFLFDHNLSNNPGTVLYLEVLFENIGAFLLPK